jgi:hypothetical protein
MNEIASAMRHRGEFLRAMANKHYEYTPSGIAFPKMGVEIAGVFNTEHRRGGDLLGRDLAPNVIPTEGLNHILDVILHAGTQVTTWSVGLFEANVTPGATLTAATVTSTLTETTAYDETTRVAYVEAAASAGVTTNSASRAEFTMNATKTIYGGFLVSASAKSATTGSLLAAAKFSASRAVVDDDVLAVAYTLTLTSS